MHLLWSWCLNYHHRTYITRPNTNGIKMTIALRLPNMKWFYRNQSIYFKQGALISHNGRLEHHKYSQKHSGHILKRGCLYRTNKMEKSYLSPIHTGLVLHLVIWGHLVICKLPHHSFGAFRLKFARMKTRIWCQHCACYLHCLLWLLPPDYVTWRKQHCRFHCQ